MLDLIAFPDHSRIWIYTSDQKISDESVAEIHHRISNFCRQWKSHNQPVKATGGLLHQYFLIFVVDENASTLGGCSIDDSVHFVQQLGRHYNVDFLNRTGVCYLQNDEVKYFKLSHISELINSGIISENTMVFDSTVKNKDEFLKHWVKPIKETWVNRFC
ncbi:MAG TPA: hypothetical protein PK006_04080 [Saprospiraceae bacterium]|nr:hypothetical protein [Saprospiraceae bacterium]